MSANILRLVDALIAPFVKAPVTGRSAAADFGPTPAAVQFQRLRAAEALLRDSDPVDHRAHDLLTEAHLAFNLNSIQTYRCVNALLDEFEHLMRAVPVGGAR